MVQEITSKITASNKNMDVLKKQFGQCFAKNGTFDIEKFKAELTKNEIDFYKESYGLDWLGKSYSRILASDEVTTLLKEDEDFNQKEENKNSQNLLIKGDNLEVLKHLSHAYYEKVKMIYIDPPYNTGNDGFVYDDKRKFTVQELRKLTGIDEDKAKRILDFTQSKSNSHSAWLTFMYPRLYIAKRLLKEDGVIFVSIDDNEVAQLRLLMDEVFGEENFVGQLPTIMNLKGNNDEFGFAGTHETTMVYASKKDYAKMNEFSISDAEFEKWEEDEIGLYKKGAPLRATGQEDKREDRPEMFYPFLVKGDIIQTVTQEEVKRLYDKDSKDFNDAYLSDLKHKYEKLGYDFILPLSNDKYGRWRWGYSAENIKRLDYDVIVNRSGTSLTLYKKQRPKLGEVPSKKPKTIFYKPAYSSGNGTSQVESLFGKKVFTNPKPIDLIKDFIVIGCDSSDIILDFFAGSGTTGDAVMQLNAEDGGTRKFILVQLPEEIDSKQNKTAYDFVKDELNIAEPTIFDITRERLIRSAAKLKNETIAGKIAGKEHEIAELKSQLDFDEKEVSIVKMEQEIKNLKEQDLGFRVFETMPIWEDYNFESDELDQQTEIFDGKQLTESDLKALLVTWKTYDGIALTESLTEVKFDKYTGYYADNKLFLMQKGFTTASLKALLEKIDNEKSFNPTLIIAFGYNFDSKNLREVSENIKSYANKKNIDIDFVTRY